MWEVTYLEAVGIELSKLPGGEQVAVRHAVEKLQALGPDLPFPHTGDVRGAPGLRELRPRGGRSPWRPLYTRTGDTIVIAAIGPDGQGDRRGFARACDRALQRLAEWQEGE